MKEFARERLERSIAADLARAQDDVQTQREIRGGDGAPVLGEGRWDLSRRSLEVSDAPEPLHRSQAMNADHFRIMTSRDNAVRGARGRQRSRAVTVGRTLASRRKAHSDSRNRV